MEKYIPELGYRVFIAHSSSNDESKPVLQPFDDAIPTPGFSSWRGLHLLRL